MDIKYTYMDDDRPIEQAEFKSSQGSNCNISTVEKGIKIIFIDRERYFTKPDLADLITLLQRFHKQLPEVE